MRNGRAADGRDKLSAHLDDTSVFGFGADHEPSDVVQEDDGCVSVDQYNKSNKGVGTYSWLHIRMNWAVFAASLGLITEIWLATIPTGKPGIS